MLSMGSIMHHLNDASSSQAKKCPRVAGAVSFVVEKIMGVARCGLAQALAHAADQLAQARHLRPLRRRRRTASLACPGLRGSRSWAGGIASHPSGRTIPQKSLPPVRLDRECKAFPICCRERCTHSSKKIAIRLPGCPCGITRSPDP